MGRIAPPRSQLSKWSYEAQEVPGAPDECTVFDLARWIAGGVPGYASDLIDTGGTDGLEDEARATLRLALADVRGQMESDEFKAACRENLSLLARYGSLVLQMHRRLDHYREQDVRSADDAVVVIGGLLERYPGIIAGLHELTGELMEEDSR